MTEQELRFHLEEYKVGRAEIAATIKLVFEVFFGAALASAAIAAWLLTNADKISQISPLAQRIAWFIPFAVAVVGCIGFYHLDSIIVRIAGYMRKLEAAMGQPGLGWETTQEANATESAQRQARLLFSLGWVVILAADLALALFVR